MLDKHQNLETENFKLKSNAYYWRNTLLANYDGYFFCASCILCGFFNIYDFRLSLKTNIAWNSQRPDGSDEAISNYIRNPLVPGE